MLDLTFGPGRLSRRDVLRLGGLAVGGLTVADIARADTHSSSADAVIMVYLPGGPSHMDMYDMKPDAPAEYCGEFKPIRTTAPGLDVCELMPRQAKLAHLFSVVRGLKTHGNHDPTELLTGIHAAASGRIGSIRRPAFGCVVSKIRGQSGPIPPYVSTSDHRLLGSYDDPEEPAYLGPEHKPVSAVGDVGKNLARHPRVSVEQGEDRRKLHATFDRLARGFDTVRDFAGVDSAYAKAHAMLTTTKVRDALDLGRESPRLRERYGEWGQDLLRARRLVQAGVTVVSVAARFYTRVPGIPDPGGWDTHGSNFKLLRAKLPIYDLGVSALLEDLHLRGMLERTAVVIWGEFGRTPKIGDVTPDGRGHWGEAGFAFLAGGGIPGGKVVGETDARGERARFRPFTPQHVLATLYRKLGVDPGRVTFPDNTGRPQYVLDRPEAIAELA